MGWICRVRLSNLFGWPKSTRNFGSTGRVSYLIYHLIFEALLLIGVLFLRRRGMIKLVEKVVLVLLMGQESVWIWVEIRIHLVSHWLLILVVHLEVLLILRRNLRLNLVLERNWRGWVSTYRLLDQSWWHLDRRSEVRTMVLFHLHGEGFVFVKYKLILIWSFIFLVTASALMLHWIRTVIAASFQALRPQNHLHCTLLKPTSSLIRSLMILGGKRLLSEQVLFALLGLISGHHVGVG